MANYLRHLADEAIPVARPGCLGMRASVIAREPGGNATALFLAPRGASDDHSAPYNQWVVVTRGSGWISIGDESIQVHAGEALFLPRDLFHRLWTDAEGMDAVAWAWETRPGAELVRVPDRAALARNAAERFVLTARRTLAERDRLSVALSGGSTPRDLYALLATPEFSHQVDWARVHLFWGDERAVPPDSPESNYRMAEQALIVHVPIPPENVHPIHAESGAAAAAREYAETLRGFFQTEGEDFPHFDLILLGLGENGHTASLFPHTSVLHDHADWVAAAYIAEVEMERITLTAPVINAARRVLFLVAGKDKANTVRAVLRGDYHPDDLPAQLVHPPDGELVWLLDREAARQLTTGA